MKQYIATLKPEGQPQLHATIIIADHIDIRLENGLTVRLDYHNGGIQILAYQHGGDEPSVAVRYSMSGAIEEIELDDHTCECLVPAGKASPWLLNRDKKEVA